MQNPRLPAAAPAPTPRAAGAPSSDSLLEGVIQRTLLDGNLTHLSEAEQVDYYLQLCRHLNLDPMTRPFDRLETETPEGKKQIRFYANKNCAEQLRKISQISIPADALITSIQGQYFIVKVTVFAPDGRTDTDQGVAYLDPKKPWLHENAMLRAVTKAKRRATLSLCGLGMIDETEAETMAEQGVASLLPPPLPSPPEHTSTKPKSPDVYRRKAMALAKERIDAGDFSTEQFAAYVRATYGVASRADMTPDQWRDLCTQLENHPEPFRQAVEAFATTSPLFDDPEVETIEDI